MYTHPSRVLQGIGASLLKAVGRELSARDSYCIPFAHLRDFYGKVGFGIIPEIAAPQFLRTRYEAYIKVGLDVIIMFRAGEKHA